MEFEPERLIEDSKELGGIDSILLWYQYPRLGVDEQKQWDFNDNIPGGKEGMRRFCERARAKGVRCFFHTNHGIYVLMNHRKVSLSIWCL